ncbi:MAG: SDR family NAD(P)-dependent oxidoreductase [Candidatus Lokiarchaeota archaeon]|nr:SDR family NAD(P)-dependent oxidoreductase [Candidatus Lokiarchaeota archaeon]MBD3339417.1 SDR family NAD(P)-dependent oxidoreductase [Candidatus Lokiarchaeota archaeon]
MKDFMNKVALITGGASGIGLGIAKRCVEEGIHIILADTDQDKLEKAKTNLKKQDIEVLAIRTDVSKVKQVEKLAERALKEFGELNLLFNNAGIYTVNQIWNHTLADYKWIISVNLWGVIHCLHIFLPILINQKCNSHIVNTASMSGFLPGQGIYGLTKHAIVSLSESLYFDIKQAKITNVGISVLCPTFVNTNLKNSEKYRPTELSNLETNSIQQSKICKRRIKKFKSAISAGQSVEIVINYLFNGIKEDRFYILTEEKPWWIEVLKKRVDYIKNGINPNDLPISF